MGEQSSGRFVWIGDGSSPFPGSDDIKNCDRGNCSAILVSGKQDTERIVETIRNCLGPEIPWLVYGTEDNMERWLNAGAAGFIPAGTPGKTIQATLHGISRLLEIARTRNPLSGLPGNMAIESRLRSHVLENHGLAAYFDISGFKPFNDYYGFSRGDAVLRSLAAILTFNLSAYFVGHVGGDDFVAIGCGGDFKESVKRVARIFNGRAGGFYSGRDHVAGGIEALDRSGEFRFYPIMDLTVSVVDGTGCSSVEELACRAGLEKKRLKGELLPDTVASFLSGGDGIPEYNDFTEWLRNSDPDILQVKALIESAGILGDTKMTTCLIEILNREKDYKVRKSAARALGNVAEQDSVEALKAALKDGNVHVRTAATMALPFVLGEKAGNYLKDAAGDRSTWVCRAALRGLGISGWQGAAGILRLELERSDEGRFWLNRRQELAAALEGAAFLGDSSLADAVAHILSENPGVKKEVIWKTLLTLGGMICVEKMLNAVESGDCFDIIRQLYRFDPHGLPEESIEKLESAFTGLDLRRGGDRIQVLRFLGRMPCRASDEISKWLLDSIERTDDPNEFEVLLETMKSREVTPRGYDLARIVDRTAKNRLKLTRKGIVSMLRWASTGKYSLSKTYLEELLRHDSREIRNAAARTVISLARKQKEQKKK
ncbi:MAG: HEAT repeat domain-containing protein [Candidatus Aegiribacteria sp.]|nr:HEAT repeat domain-containing protein [Candidatus Aegiribacteria sp.]